MKDSKINLEMKLFDLELKCESERIALIKKRIFKIDNSVKLLESKRQK